MGKPLEHNPVSEKLEAAWVSTQKSFNEVVGTDPQKAQAYALIGICYALNSIARMLAWESYDLDLVDE